MHLSVSFAEQCEGRRDRTHVGNMPRSLHKLEEIPVVLDFVALVPELGFKTM